MQLPSPFEGKPFKKTVAGKGYHYTQSRQEEVTVYKPLYPDRPNSPVVEQKETVEVPLDGEIVDLTTGQSDSKYWQPETVLDPTGCQHQFHLVTSREVICDACGWTTMLHPALNVVENKQGLFIVIKGRRYQITC